MNAIKKFFQALGRHKGKIIMVLLLVAAGVAIAAMWNSKGSTPEYMTAPVTKGDLRMTVNATGTVQAITTVQVGSQISGTIASLGADFNSRVQKGQVVARLDPSTFQAQVENAQAALQSAQAGEETARTALTEQLASVESAQANAEVLRVQWEDAQRLAERNKELVAVISTRDIESSAAGAAAAKARYQQSKAQLEQTKAGINSARAKVLQAGAQVKQSQSQLEQAKINLERTIITSPIDGIVVSRSVDVGQTVAASLQAPTLFTIANDLTKMQVLASIDEADVGRVKEGQSAIFTVDAFPGENFKGELSQLRLNSVLTQNVVTYSAVITFENRGEKLRPGMTASVTIPVAERTNVLKIPNAALRFKPPADAAQLVSTDGQNQQRQGRRGGGDRASGERGQGERGERGQGERGQRSSDGNRPADADKPADSNKPADTNKTENSNSSGGANRLEEKDKTAVKDGNQAKDENRGSGAGDEGGRRGDSESGERRRNRVTIWVLKEDKTITPRRVETGLTDGRETEIVSGDLNEGDKVVIGRSDPDGGSRPQTQGSPFNARPGGGSRSRGGGR